jgi:hypothetical protein
MQVQHIGYRIRGFYRVAALGYLWDMTPKDAQRRFEILRFFDKHGLAATRDAFGVSRRTLYRRKATLKAQGGNPAALAAKSYAPKKRRKAPNPQDRPQAGDRDPPLAHALPQSWQEQTPRGPWPLVR